MSKGILEYAIVTDRTGAAKAPPAGQILAHNAVPPASAQTKQGAKGFRFFAVAPSGLWVVCDCGWRPDLGAHYRAFPSPLRGRE
jgi:hypothetical protein